jgi:hypothetical protein
MKKLFATLFVGLGILVSVIMLLQYKQEGKFEYTLKPNPVGVQNLEPSNLTVVKQMFTEQFEIPDSTGTKLTKVQLSSRINFDKDIDAVKNSANIWEFSWDDSIMQIIVSPNESNPFGVNLQPSVAKIDNVNFMKQIYRISTDSISSFYTDSYYFDTCGNKYCSNGFINYSDSIMLQITCSSGNELATQICDEFVSNLKIGD